MKVNRSSSKRAYKKRRTVRKSRVIRRRKTQRGGINFGSLAKGLDLSVIGNGLQTVAASASSATGGLTAITTLSLKLKEIGSATTYPKVLFDILVNFARDPKKALDLLNSKRDGLLKLLDAKDDIKNCLSTLETKIKERIAQSASVAAVAAAAAAAASKVAVTPLSSTTFLDVIIAKKEEFSKAPDKGEMIKGVIQTKINEVNTAIDGYLKDPSNAPIIECIKLLKDRMTAKIQANAEDLKTKFTEIRSKYSDQEAKLMGLIEMAKAFMDTLKQSVVAAGCPVCPVCKS